MAKLNEIPDKSPFRVPEGYFEDVTRKIISETTGTKNTERKPVIHFRFKSVLLAAASIAGFVVLSYTAVKLLSAERIRLNHSEVIMEDYSSPYNDIDIYSLEENAASLVIPENGPDASKSDIIDYLLLENIEISEIYEQL